MPTFKDGSSLADSNRTPQISQGIFTCQRLCTPSSALLNWDLNFPTYRGKWFVKNHTEEHGVTAAASEMSPAPEHCTSPPGSWQVRLMLWHLLCQEDQQAHPRLGVFLQLFLASSPEATQLQQLWEDNRSAEQHAHREEGRKSLQWAQETLPAALPSHLPKKNINK